MGTRLNTKGGWRGQGEAVCWPVTEDRTPAPSSICNWTCLMGVSCWEPSSGHMEVPEMP